MIGVTTDMNKKFLMVVDMQQGFMNNDNYKNLNDKIIKLIDNNQYDVIILTKFINRNNSLYETKLNWEKLKDEESQNFSFEVPNNALVYEKYGYGLDVEQINNLKSLGIKEIDLSCFSCFH